jgi:hypothetical protein
LEYWKKYNICEVEKTLGYLVAYLLDPKTLLYPYLLSSVFYYLVIRESYFSKIILSKLLRLRWVFIEIIWLKEDIFGLSKVIYRLKQLRGEEIKENDERGEFKCNIFDIL